MSEKTDNSKRQPGIKLAKLIANRGLCSRREAEGWIQAGRVVVNGSRMTVVAERVDPDADRVEVDGVPLPQPRKDLYIAFHKPTGVLSTFKKSKEKGQTLEGMMPYERRLFVAGRLDRDSSGLLILTTDGEWANHVMHPRYEKEKEYLVRFKGLRPTPSAKLFSKATINEDGVEYRAASVAPEGSYVRVVLKEGRNRQIRRLAQAAGLQVRELIRIRIGSVTLGSIKPAHWRELSQQEVTMLDGS